MESRTSGKIAISLGRVTTLLLAGRGARFAIALINSIIIARVLGVERLGAYAYAMGIAALFGLLPNMGIAIIVTRSIARHPDGGTAILRTALNAQALASAATFVVIPAVAALLPRQPVPLVYVWLAAAQLTLGTLSWPYLGVLSGRARYDYVALAELISAFAGTASVVVAALLYGTPVAFLSAHVVAAMLAAVTARRLARPFLQPRDGKSISLWSLLRHGLPFGVTAAADSLYRRLDILLLGQMASTVALGLYNVAYKPTNMVVYFGTTIAGPLFPLMAREREATAPHSFRRALRGMGVLAPTMSLFLSGMAVPLLRLLYGDAFAPAAPIMVVLVWSAAAHWLYAPLSVALQARGKERWWLGALLAALMLNVAGNAWAIPRWGAIGAAGATLASEVALLSLGAVMICRYFRSLPPLRPVLVGLTATAVSGGVLWILLPGGGPLVATLTALITYTVPLMLFRVVRAKDVATVLRWIREATPAWPRRREVRPETGSREITSVSKRGD